MPWAIKIRSLICFPPMVLRQRLPRQEAFNAPQSCVILGAQANFTVFKAFSLLGFGRENLKHIPCDNQGRMPTKP